MSRLSFSRLGRWCGLFVLGLLSGSWLFGARPPAPPVALVGGDLYPIAQPPIPGGWILFREGKIAALGGGPGADAPIFTADVQIVQLAPGTRVYPGLIAANTTVGLMEIAAVRATIDLQETGDLNPNARAEVAVSADGEHPLVTRLNGVLAALSVPGRGISDEVGVVEGAITGTSALLQLDGYTWEEMTVRAPVGMNLMWPGMTIDEENTRVSAKKQREGLAAAIAKLDDAIAATRAYAARRAADPATPSDLRLEAMIPVVEGRLPVFIQADTLAQIRAAVTWAQRHHLKMVLVGGLDAWRAAPLLKAADVPVIVSPVNALPLRRSDPYDAPMRNAALLHAAGVRFCLSTSPETFANPGNDRNLPYEAATAIAFGLPAEAALKAITLSAAEILGAADRLGSLAVGKDATVFLASGDPFELSTSIPRAWIAGREIRYINRQTLLRDRYLERFGQPPAQP